MNRGRSTPAARAFEREYTRAGARRFKGCADPRTPVADDDDVGFVVPLRDGVDWQGFAGQGIVGHSVSLG